MKKLLLIAALIGCFSGLAASEKMYINPKQLNTKHNAFRVHVGHNQWIHTNTVHRDETGLFTFESDIAQSAVSKGYEREWKCPYCHQFWPIGKPCGNSNCPSKYR